MFVFNTGGYVMLIIPSPNISVVWLSICLDVITLISLVVLCYFEAHKHK
jgi:hypothetical protein